MCSQNICPRGFKVTLVATKNPEKSRDFSFENPGILADCKSRDPGIPGIPLGPGGEGGWIRGTQWSVYSVCGEKPPHSDIFHIPEEFLKKHRDCECCPPVVDRPTQLICISDIYLLYVNIKIQKTLSLLIEGSLWMLWLLSQRSEMLCSVFQKYQPVSQLQGHLFSTVVLQVDETNKTNKNLFKERRRDQLCVLEFEKEQVKDESKDQQMSLHRHRPNGSLPKKNSSNLIFTIKFFRTKIETRNSQMSPPPTPDQMDRCQTKKTQPTSSNFQHLCKIWFWPDKNQQMSPPPTPANGSLPNKNFSICANFSQWP